MERNTSAGTIYISKSASANCPERKVQPSLMKCLLHSMQNSSGKYKADNILKNSHIVTTPFCLGQIGHTQIFI